MQKSLNQLYKESGTTLSYKEWRKREDEKMASFDGITIPNPSEQIKQSSSYQETQRKISELSGYKTDISGKTVFGINKNVILVGGVIILTAIGFKLYQKYKK